ncbi:hypothetical protein P5V15_005858 [Pogonomyrmex californicus]
MTKRAQAEGEGIKGMLREIMEEVRELKKEMRDQREGLKEEIKEMKAEMKKKKENWRRESEELRQEIRDMRGKVERMEMQEGGKKEEEGRGGRGEKKKEEAELEGKIRNLERWREMEERERRRRNVLVKEVEVKEGGIRKAIEKIWERMEIEARIEDIREIGKGRGMAIVRMKDRKGKIEVMKKKAMVRDEMVRIEDWTRKERVMQWRLEELARRERRNNRRVWVRYGRIWMKGRWWRWDEEKEKLLDGRGQVKEWREKGGRKGEEERKEKEEEKERAGN